MLKRLINSLLLTGKHKFDKDKNNTAFTNLSPWQTKSCEIKMFGETISQKYFFYQDFDEKKDTIIYWPGNIGAKYFLNEYIQLGEKYNIIVPEFFGYPLQLEHPNNAARVVSNIPKKCTSLTFDHVVEAAEKVTEKIRNKLKQLYEISDDRTINQKINLLGFSMGSMVAMKIAAKMQQPFKKLVLIAPVINMSIASRRFLETLPQSISCALDIDLRKVYLGITVITLLACSIFFSAILGIFKGAVQLPNNISLEYSANIGASLPTLFISLFLLCYFWEASKVGVSKDDIKKLQSQTVHFIQVEGDQFCDRKKIAKIVKGKGELSFIYITKSNLNSNEGDNIKDPNDAHCYLTSDKALTNFISQEVTGMQSKRNISIL